MRVRRLRAGGAVLQPGVVAGGAEVAEFEAPPAPAGDLGDDPFDAGPVLPVILTEGGLGGPAGAGGAQQRFRCTPPRSAPPSPAPPGPPGGCRDQLGDGVLGRHRIRQDRRIHRPPPALHHAGLRDHPAHRVANRCGRSDFASRRRTPAWRDRTRHDPAGTRTPPSTADHSGPPPPSPRRSSRAAPAAPSPMPSRSPGPTADPAPTGTGPQDGVPDATVKNS